MAQHRPHVDRGIDTETLDMAAGDEPVLAHSAFQDAAAGGERGGAERAAGGLLQGGVWAVGGLAAGRLHLGWAHTRDSGLARPVVQPVALALLSVGVFVAGAVVVGPVPWLADRVDAVLDHARYGSLPIVWLITVVTGVGEELFFRGALFAAVGSRHALAVTTLVYTLVTAATGNVMLTFAALLLGLLTGAQRRVTGGVLAPIITHVIWSSSMLVLLPPALDLLR